MSQLKVQIQNCVTALYDTRNSFANGGHSYNGISLGMTTGAACIAALNSASSQLNSVCARHERQLEELQIQYFRLCGK